MLDHISISVSNLDASREFYRTALTPLGYEVLMEGEWGAGLGRDGKPDFWLQAGTASGPIHIAFLADNRATVDQFYTSAIDAGGKDNGGPGLRPEYHPTYYGAFVFDPDGNNVEAVCHTEE